MNYEYWWCGWYGVVCFNKNQTVRQIWRKVLFFACLPMSQSSRLNEVLHWCCPSEVSQWLGGTKPPQTRDTAVTRRYGWPLTAHREKLDKVDVIFIYCMGNNVLCSIHTASSEFSSTAGLMWNLKCLWLLSRSKCSYFFKLILRRGAAARKRRQEV